jgi:exoribonuclease R
MEAQELMESNSESKIAISVRNLNKIAKKLKQKRLNEGALTLASTQVKVTLE